MENIGVEIVLGSEQYILYYFYYANVNKLRKLFLPSLEMANNVYKVLSYFTENFNRGYLGGFLGRGIGKSLFTKINDNEMMNSEDITINIAKFIEGCEELMKYKYHDNLQKNYYDEFMLTVLKYAGFFPRIKRTKFILNPFSNDFGMDYIETDEKTIREMGLVIKD